MSKSMRQAAGSLSSRVLALRRLNERVPAQSAARQLAERLLAELMAPARRLQDRFEREELIRLALLKDGVDDAARACALCELRELRRRQLKAESRTRRRRDRKKLPPLSPGWRARIVDWRLEDLFKGIGLRISRSENPVAAAKRLFEPKGKRGPKIKNDDRDFEIVVSVQRLEIEGLSFEDAVARNALLEEIGESRVKQIVKAQRAEWSALGIKAEAELVGLQAAAHKPVKSQDS